MLRSPLRSVRQCRTIVWFALLAYLVATTGIPLPSSRGKQRGVAYPCQHHACGCLSAAECWDHCCCYTPRQKLAWAREYHVEPPARLVAEVAAIDLLAMDHERSEEAGAHCSHCADRTATTNEHKHAEHDDHDICHSAPSDDGGMTLVLSIVARKCRGLSDLWCAAGAVTPPPVATAWQFQWDIVAWIGSDDQAPPIQHLSPPVPPPRV